MVVRAFTSNWIAACHHRRHHQAASLLLWAHLMRKLTAKTFLEKGKKKRAKNMRGAAPQIPASISPFISSVCSQCSDFGKPINRTRRHLWMFAAFSSEVDTHRRPCSCLGPWFCPQKVSLKDSQPPTATRVIFSAKTSGFLKNPTSPGPSMLTML